MPEGAFQALVGWGGWSFVGFVSTAALALIVPLLPYQHGLLLKQLGDSTDRTRIRERLSTDAGIGRRFCDGLNGFLNHVDRYFGPPFGWRAFDRCLLHAYLYPIVLFGIAWVAGASGGLGSVDILASAEVCERFWRALLLIAAPTAIIILANLNMRLNDKPRFVGILLFTLAAAVAFIV